jgi:hypothetical protein
MLSTIQDVVSASESGKRVRATSSRSVSLHDVTERSRVFAHTCVTRHNRHQLRWLADRFCGRDVNGIKRPNWFDGKRPPGARKHVVCDCDDVAPALEAPQRANGSAFGVHGQSSADACTDNSARGLRERQRGGNRSIRPRSQRFQRFAVTFKECSEQRARLDIANVHDRTLGRRCERSGGRVAARCATLTLRHDLRRSDLRPCRAGVECPANPRWGRRFRVVAESCQLKQAGRNGLPCAWRLLRVPQAPRQRARAP